MLFALAASAHHSDAGRYNEEIVVMSGTVVAVNLINPHSIIVIDVEQDGKTVRWQCEMGAPRVLMRDFGWTRDTLKPGDKITVTGRAIKTGAPYLNLTERAQIRRTETGEEIFQTENYQDPVLDASEGG